MTDFGDNLFLALTGMVIWLLVLIVPTALREGYLAWRRRRR